MHQVLQRSRPLPHGAGFLARHHWCLALTGWKKLSQNKGFHRLFVRAVREPSGIMALLEARLPQRSHGDNFGAVSENLPRKTSRARKSDRSGIS